MYYNVPNVVVDGVLTDEEISQVYDAVNNNSGSSFVEVHSQANVFIQLPQSILDKFISHARNISGIEGLMLTEYCYARYSNVTSDCGKVFRPSLFPHVDETFKEPRFTFDYQLNANVSWDIIVEDKVLSLSNNQAGTFSGTHQVHWREPKAFSDDQFVEMIFCHFTDPNEAPKSDEVQAHISQKAADYKMKFFANGGFSNA